uniref:Zinc finger, CCHC-type n=1 Tax=Tanacetum cinerariifolium TaxID=118510 RepID=A0A6L2K6P3_TANCI|nr:zinc finger, CCHC-type [Tanacetum cinerariifolium]
MDAIFDEIRFSSIPRLSQRSLINRTENIDGLVVPEKVTEEKETINDEMGSIMRNNTWVFADLSPGYKPLSCKWIFKRKLKMDVKKTFLTSELDEEVYMNQPQGFIMPGNKNKVDLTNEFLTSRFSMKDMGEADVILVSTPIDTNEKLMPNNGQAVSQLEYYNVIGFMLYAMTYARPNIAFAVGKLSMYTSNPGIQHWQAIQRVLKYLKKTIDCNLIYTGYPSVLEGYTDSSWISNTEDNSSISGWVFLLGVCEIAWASKKQTCITSSTMKYDFVALATAGKEAEWLRNLILDIPLWSKLRAPISILCDSAATLAKAYSQIYNGKSRHLGVRHNMIHKLIMNGVVSIVTPSKYDTNLNTTFGVLLHNTCTRVSINVQMIRL